MIKLLILLFLISIFSGYVILNGYRRGSDKVVIIPAYFYPTGYNMKYWEDIISYRKSGHKVIVIVNQNNGNFVKEDSNYRKIISKLQGADITIQGYVSTRWGQRDPLQVKKDIDSWKDIYNVDSIFLDEASSEREQYSYYTHLSAYIKGETTYNFGTTPHNIYDKLDGIKVLFEDKVDNLHIWNRDHPFNKKDTAIIVHSVEGDKWKNWFKNNKDSFKYYYFTDGIMDNPYDKLTIYLEDPAE